MSINLLQSQLNWCLRRLWGFCISWVRTGNFLRCFSLPGISIGYIQIFLVLTRPRTPRANTLHSWAALLREFQQADTAECVLNLKYVAGSAGTYMDRGLGFEVTFSESHASVSSLAPGVYGQPLGLRGHSSSSRLSPGAGGSQWICAWPAYIGTGCTGWSG